MLEKLNGICPIIATPFTANGYIDTDSFQSLVRHLLGTGIAAVTLFGLATEFYKLTDTEKETLTALMLAETATHPTVAGVVSITAHSWEVATIQAQRAEEAGADVIMVLPPFFLHPGEDAITAHIAQVASSVEVPVIVQYAPLQTGVSLAPTVFLRLSAAHPNLHMVKVETQPPGPYVSALLTGAKGRLAALVGYAGVQMPDALMRGAAGVQPGCSFAEIYVELFRLFRDGDVSGMRTLHTQLLPYIGYWMQGVELIIQAEKSILYRRGIIATDYCRAPGYPLDATELEMIERFLTTFSTLLAAS